MKDLRLTQSEIGLLSELLKEPVSIIWDLDAFYFNSAKSTYKLECFDDIPDGSDNKYDEITFCRFTKLDKQEKFIENESDFWYKIIATSSTIQAIDLIEVVQRFPGEELIDESAVKNEIGINKLTSGLIIYTKEGLIPALLLPSWFGFNWLEKFDFYTLKEVEEILYTRINKFKLKKLHPSPVQENNF